ncbi:hypothetical protein [Nocardiopsis ansamitocini]|uniref:Uncharacterized protein n=1 Tax=Nocardiopsis ansamitocini TaxID=1670832 RepID=A0A9W6UHS5_9ACTN|nr:hypothetical protein [Nocardiopsis ansamitocini]GLU46310.1 hypothetical protein Nans01_06610 [Nocardiopsis ansamitocini]
MDHTTAPRQGLTTLFLSAIGACAHVWATVGSTTSCTRCGTIRW